MRVIRPDDLQAVTPDASAKDHFVIADAVGMCEQDKTDAVPLEKKPGVNFEKLHFEKLLQAVAFGNTEEDVLTSVAGRLARLRHRLNDEDEARIAAASGGLTLQDLSHGILESLDPDRFPPGDPASEAAAQEARREAVKPLHDPALRALLVELKKKNEITIDHVSQDQVLEAGLSEAALDRARSLVQSFEAFLEEHRDEITALQILYSRPYGRRLTFEAVKELAEAIEQPPYL